MAGPTQGLIEFPLSTREANMEMRGLIRAYDELAKSAEKYYAKAGRAESERAVAAEAYHKALENKAQIAKNLGDKEKQQAEQLIPLILQKKQQILDEVAAHKEKLKILREIEQVNERRAGHVAKALSVNATDIAMTEGQIAGYEGQMSASPAARTAEENRALRERIELKKQEFVTRRQAAEEENEAFGAEVARLHAKTRMQQEYNEEVGKARLRIITPEEIEADTRRAARQIKERNEALAAQVSGPASLSMDERGLAIKRQLAEVENYYQGAIEGRAKAAINAAKIEAEAADIAKLAASAKDPLIEKEAAYHVELSRVSREIEQVQKKMKDLAVSEVGTSEQRTQAMHALAQRLVPLQKEQRELNRNIEGGTGGLLKNRMAMQQVTYAFQDFISGGGMQNVAMGMRGAANNIEMVTMSLGKQMSPLQIMGLGLLPTVALAAVEMGVGFKTSGNHAKESADGGMKDYRNELQRIRDVGENVVETEYRIASAREYRQSRAMKAKLSEELEEKKEKSRKYGSGDGGPFGNPSNPFAGTFEEENKLVEQWERDTMLLEEYKRTGKITPGMKIPTALPMGMYGRVIEERKLRKDIANTQGRITDIESEERKAQQRIQVQSLASKHRTKMIELLAQGRRAGLTNEQIRAKAREFFRGVSVDADVADQAADVVVRDVQMQESERRMESELEQKLPVGKAKRKVETLRTQLEEEKAKKHPNRREIRKTEKEINDAEAELKRTERAWKDDPTPLLKGILDGIAALLQYTKEQNEIMKDGGQPQPAAPRPPNLGFDPNIANPARIMRAMGW